EGYRGPVGVFTGGSLLFRTTGRTDLLGEQHNHELARHQYDSARKLVETPPDGAQIWPTHGFGSFCASGQTSADSATIGVSPQQCSHGHVRHPAHRVALNRRTTRRIATPTVARLRLPSGR